MINLPKEWMTYSNSIKDRCRDLIEFKIWSGLDVNRLDNWRKNFKSDEEKYFAACILDWLIYRSNQQTYSLIHKMLFKNLNNVFRLLNEKDFQNFPYCLNQVDIDPLIRFVSVLIPSSTPTKSSNEILRFMRRHYKICAKWIINPWDIEGELKKGVSKFIFIDDFLGTGRTFQNVILMNELKEVVESNSIIYAPLVAHTIGEYYLRTEFPKLLITSSETLDKSSHSFFSNYFPNEIEAAKKFYINMLLTRDIKLSEENMYGYGNLELTFAFEHAAPDNSLHLLHQDVNWFPLFNK